MGVTGVQNRRRQVAQSRSASRSGASLRAVGSSEPEAQSPNQIHRGLAFRLAEPTARREIAAPLKLALMVSVRRARHAEPQRFGPEGPRERTVIGQTYLV